MHMVEKSNIEDRSVSFGMNEIDLKTCFLLFDSDMRHFHRFQLEYYIYVYIV